VGGQRASAARLHGRKLVHVDASSDSDVVFRCAYLCCFELQAIHWADLRQPGGSAVDAVKEEELRRPYTRFDTRAIIIDMPALTPKDSIIRRDASCAFCSIFRHPVGPLRVLDPPLSRAIRNIGPPAGSSNNTCVTERQETIVPPLVVSLPRPPLQYTSLPFAVARTTGFMRLSPSFRRPTPAQNGRSRRSTGNHILHPRHLPRFGRHHCVVCNLATPSQRLPRRRLMRQPRPPPPRRRLPHRRSRAHCAQAQTFPTPQSRT
jgi:hypothetical protein